MPSGVEGFCVFSFELGELVVVTVEDSVVVPCGDSGFLVVSGFGDVSTVVADVAGSVCFCDSVVVVMPDEFSVA